MTLIPAASRQSEDESIQDQPETDSLRVVGNVGAVDFINNIAAKTASGSGTAASGPKIVLDQNMDEMDPFAAILANPQWGGVATLAAAASFDTVVPSAVAAAYGNLFWNAERNGEFSISTGGGSLETTFLQMFGDVDENGKKKNDDDALDSYVDAQERRAQVQREIEEKWDHQMSDRFAGMTNEEALNVLRYMDQNSDKMADEAAAAGKIKESEKEAYKEYIKLLRQDAEYQRTHAGKRDPALATKITDYETTYTTFKPTVASQASNNKDFVLSARVQKANETTITSDSVKSGSNFEVDIAGGLEDMPQSSIDVDYKFRSVLNSQLAGNAEKVKTSGSENSSTVASRADLSPTSLNPIFNQNASTTANTTAPSADKPVLASAEPIKPEISTAGASFGVG